MSSVFYAGIVSLVLLGLNNAGMPALKIGFPWERIPLALHPVLIFFLRASDITLATLRMLTVVRGRPLMAWIIGFLQAGLFISVVAGIIANLANPLNLIAFAAGFATGNVIGITLESRLVPGHSLLRIVSVRFGDQITETLHKAGKGVTEVAGQGRQGVVGYLYCFIPRKEVLSTRDQITAIDPQAFITVENVRQLQGGWKA